MEASQVDASDIASEGPTTGRTVAKQDGSRRPWVSRNPGHLAQLAPKHRLMIQYMVWGCDHASLARRVGHNVGTPLTAEEAGSVLGMRLRASRWLSMQPVFQNELARALSAFRNGQHPAAWAKVAALMNDEGEGKAADRKVQLQAAQTLLGEQAKGVTVNVNTQVNAATQNIAGYVIDLSGAQADQPTNQQTGRQPRGPVATTIDLTAEQSDDDAGGL